MPLGCTWPKSLRVLREHRWIRGLRSPTGLNVGTLNLPAADDLMLRTIIAPGEKFTIKFDHNGYDYSCQRLAAGPFKIQIPLGVPAGAETLRAGAGL